MARFLKTETDIIRLMIEAKEELTGYEITRRLYNLHHSDQRTITNRSNFVYRIIRILYKKDILIRKNSYPIFFRINPEIAGDIKKETIYYEVRCPSCEKSLWINESQKTKQCSCLKENGQNRRFWVLDSNLTGRKKVL